MENRRYVETILTIFDVVDCSALSKAGMGPTRVMLHYEKKENRKQFTILDRSMPQQLIATVTSWLEENFDLNKTL